MFPCLLSILKAFPFHTPKSSKYQVGKYSTDCISVTVLLVLDVHRVAMDTSFCPGDHFSATPNLKHYSSQAHQILMSLKNGKDYSQSMTS